MEGNRNKRITRLTTILTQLQSKKVITAREIANRYNISIRTVYRDIRTLEQSGIPIATEEGRGYSLVDGYRMPPVMFSEQEANALITAEQLISRNKDESLVINYKNAILKIKAVLRCNEKEKVELLSQRILFRQNIENDITSNYLSLIQHAITNFCVSKLEYNSLENELTNRLIEPFAMYSTQENWLLIAFCRLRNDFRAFRLDRMMNFTMLDEKFEPHKMTLQEFFEKCQNRSQI